MKVLAHHPSTVSVFEKHGLMGCGGAAGPDERIDLFAMIHHIDVGALLHELNEAKLRPSEPRCRHPDPPDVYRGFIRAAIVCTLSGSARPSGRTTFAIHWALGAVPPAYNWAHAGGQIWGFVLLIMGVSYRALSRFFGTELAHPSRARGTLVLAILGLSLFHVRPLR